MYQDNNNEFIKPDHINLGRYFRLILLQSKMIVAITLAGLILGISYYLASTKTYKVTSLLQVYSPEKSFAPETNIDNLVTLYSSRSNVLDLINTLNLNIKLDNTDDIEILDIKTFLFKSNKDYQQKIFYLQIKNNSFSLLDDQKNTL